MPRRARPWVALWAMRRRSLLAALLACALPLASAATASATPAVGKVCDTSWKAPVDGDWGDASMWTHGVPDSPTSACITVNGTYTVHVTDESTGARSLTLGAAGGHQTVSIEGSCDGGAALDIAPSGYRHEFGIIGPNATVRLSDTGCDAPATLEEDRGTLVNEGTIEVDATSAAAPRTLWAYLKNKGTIRFGAETRTLVNIGIVDSPSSVTEIHLGANGGPSFVDSEPGIRLGGTLAIVTDPDFAATDGSRFNLCTNCAGRFPTVTGQTLPHHFVVSTHYSHAPDGYPSLDLTFRKQHQ
jgi:hypothetical protein